MKMRLCFLLLSMSACASKPFLPSVAPSEAVAKNDEFLMKEEGGNAAITEKTEIRPGFLLRLISSSDKALNTSVRVSLLGEIKLPYGGSMSVAGMTLKNLETKLNDQFRSLYKSSPQITVQITEKKFFVDVRGLVQKPGSLLVDEREKIEDIIRKVGGRSLNEDAGGIQIIRGENNYYVDLTEYFQGRGLDRSPRWYGGEKVLFVRASTALTQADSDTVHLLGDVRTPGAIAFRNKADFYHYLVKAGGTTASSDLDRVQVVRQTPQGPVTTSGSAIDIAQNIELAPGDTIIMGSSMPGRYERGLQLGSTIATILSAIGILIIAL